MTIYKRPESQNYFVEVTWRGHGRIRLSAGTTSKTRARHMELTLCRLRDAGRRDIITLLVERRLSFQDVHDAYQGSPAALEQQIARMTSPTIGPLVDEWFAWIAAPGTLSPRTRRPYAPKSVERYRESWDAMFKVLTNGRDAMLSAITRGFVLDFRAVRRKAGLSGSTLNRDLAGLQSFLRWAEEERGLTTPHFRMPREREPEGRERWLDAAEIAALEEAMHPDWWPLFAMLIFTGLRVGEAQGLRWNDVRLTERRIRVHEGSGRRVKTAASQRDVPIPEPLAELLAEYAAHVRGRPTDHVFAGEYAEYWHAKHQFESAVRRAKLDHVTIHDLRHTFGVHCAQAGVPLPRLQKLMGHASAVMTMRYMKHAPEAYFAEDAARVAASFTRAVSDEIAADRKSLRLA